MVGGVIITWVQIIRLSAKIIGEVKKFDELHKIARFRKNTFNKTDHFLDF